MVVSNVNMRLMKKRLPQQLQQMQSLFKALYMLMKTVMLPPAISPVLFYKWITINFVLMHLDGILTELMVKIAPKLYRKFIWGGQSPLAQMVVSNVIMWLKKKWLPRQLQQMQSLFKALHMLTKTMMLPPAICPVLFYKWITINFVSMRLDGILAELMVKVAPKLYPKFITINAKGKLVLYVQLEKAAYGMMESTLLFYCKLVADLTSLGFEINPTIPALPTNSSMASR